MTVSHPLEPVVQRLQSALEGDVFPSEFHQWGTRLLDHLRKPVQVAVVGMPGSGKSALINMLLGQQAIPRVQDLPVIEIAHGLKSRSLFELDDGTCIRRSGEFQANDVPENTVRARLELDDDSLLRQNFVEVGLTDNAGHQASMVNWITQWADIVLWCTESFDETEQRLWAGVPDDIKDHSFLVLTMADRQMMRGVLQQRIEELEPIVSEEFLCLYPIATEQAITARTAGAKLNHALWKSSGGEHLMSGVSQQIENGRTADMDQAQMLLNKFVREADRIVNLPASNTDVRPAAVKPGGKGKDPTLASALKLLQDCANDMLAEYANQKEPQAEKILNKCVESANRLAEMLQATDPRDLMAQDLQLDTEDSAEMMLLFQLERDEDAAVDAVTLLLQLKKEIAHAAGTPIQS